MKNPWRPANLSTSHSSIAHPAAYPEAQQLGYLFPSLINVHNLIWIRVVGQVRHPSSATHPHA